MILRRHKRAIYYCVVMLVVGAVFNRHQWDPWASESREAITCFPSIPVPLFGDGRGETRFRQRTAAGRSEEGWLVKLRCCVVFLSYKVKKKNVPLCSIHSWNWPSRCPASPLSFWQPRKLWGVTAKPLSLLLKSPLADASDIWTPSSSGLQMIVVSQMPLHVCQCFFLV